MSDFHFLRPEWLWLLLAVPVVPWLWRRMMSGGHGWESVIPGALLSPLLTRDAGPQRPRRVRGGIPALLLLIASLSLSGPAWRQTPHPLQERTDSLAVVLDLSLSMLATDLSPDRLTRAKQKIRDLLSMREGALTGLVVYAADAHVVTPLTEDRRTIEALLPAVDPFIMPANGSRPDRGVAKAIELLKRGGQGPGQILLVTDGIDQNEAEAIRDQLGDTPYRLNVLAVGTESGGPIPLPDQGFIQDQGEIVIAKTPLAPLQSLAQANGGEATRITLGDQDLKTLDLNDLGESQWRQSDRKRQLDLWHDDGYWLAWLLLPLVLWGWRRGVLATGFVAVLLLHPQPSLAFGWDDLWKTPDQQGAELFAEQPEAAAKTFEDPAWKGSALYRAGDYEEAAKAFSQLDTADAHYNRGNALAKAGQYQKAIEAYDQALEQNPDLADARANKKLIEDLLKQQKKEQNQQNQQQNQDQQSSQGQNNQQSSQGGQDNQNQSQQGQQNQQGSQGQAQQGRQQSGSQGNPQQDQSGQQDSQNGSEAQQQQSQSGAGESGEAEKNKQQETQQQAAGPSSEKQSGDQPQGAGMSEGPTEAEQSREQWLRRVPDDPGGLLRRKFLHQYRRQAPQDSEEDEPW
ncbi:VWA domain-containing protein [Marinobacteraceae bacterium S3BR75-40.1]